MDFSKLQKGICNFLENSPENYVSAEDAIRPDLAGMRIYDEPIFGVADACDELFLKLKSPEVVGEGYMLPADWLAGAKSVLSFFLPFTAEVRRSNREQNGAASDEWLHARIEGQMMMEMLCEHVCKLLDGEGFSAIVPATDSRFKMIAPFASNWSERHTAYVCGLGTFGLSKGLITKKGMAGRFGSVITDAPLPVTVREYSDPFEYCSMCGKCQKNCPAGAIDISRGVIHGKEHTVCSGFINKNRRPPHGPNNRKRYGCGKCQVAVPCESAVPKRKMAQ